MKSSRVLSIALLLLLLSSVVHAQGAQAVISADGRKAPRVYAAGVFQFRMQFNGWLIFNSSGVVIASNTDAQGYSISEGTPMGAPFSGNVPAGTTFPFSAYCFNITVPQDRNAHPPGTYSFVYYKGADFASFEYRATFSTIAVNAPYFCWEGEDMPGSNAPPKITIHYVNFPPPADPNNHPPPWSEYWTANAPNLYTYKFLDKLDAPSGSTDYVPVIPAGNPSYILNIGITISRANAEPSLAELDNTNPDHLWTTFYPSSVITVPVPPVCGAQAYQGTSDPPPNTPVGTTAPVDGWPTGPTEPIGTAPPTDPTGNPIPAPVPPPGGGWPTGPSGPPTGGGGGGGTGGPTGPPAGGGGGGTGDPTGPPAGGGGGTGGPTGPPAGGGGGGTGDPTGPPAGGGGGTGGPTGPPAGGGGGGTGDPTGPPAGGGGTQSGGNPPTGNPTGGGGTQSGGNPPTGNPTGGGGTQTGNPPVGNPTPDPTKPAPPLAPIIVPRQVMLCQGQNLQLEVQNSKGGTWEITGGSNTPGAGLGSGPSAPSITSGGLLTAPAVSDPTGVVPPANGTFEVRYTDGAGAGVDKVTVYVSEQFCYESGGNGLVSAPTDTGGGAACAALPFPVLTFAPASRFFEWPGQLLSYGTRILQWLFIPAPCAGDSVKADLQQVLTWGPLALPSQLHAAWAAGGGCAPPDPQSMALTSPLDFMTGCGAPGSGIGAGFATTSPPPPPPPVPTLGVPVTTHDPSVTLSANFSYSGPVSTLYGPMAVGVGGTSNTVTYTFTGVGFSVGLFGDVNCTTAATITVDGALQNTLNTQPFNGVNDSAFSITSLKDGSHTVSVGNLTQKFLVVGGFTPYTLVAPPAAPHALPAPSPVGAHLISPHAALSATSGHVLAPDFASWWPKSVNFASAPMVPAVMKGTLILVMWSSFAVYLYQLAMKEVQK